MAFIILITKLPFCSIWYGLHKFIAQALISALAHLRQIDKNAKVEGLGSWIALISSVVFILF